MEMAATLLKNGGWRYGSFKGPTEGNGKLCKEIL